MEEKSIMDYETLALDDEENALVIIDQTKLPGRTELLHLKTQKEIWVAINTLQVRGPRYRRCGGHWHLSGSPGNHGRGL